ncbi:hypothetical protein PCASD_08881 [Puccinia coronata f. sp. avenae]|uniref:Uncharacterized protein n=1 Tax=Puccinia coronata f. sp. avenae TaxID=200324 RepID=A0A2N5UUD4_9BASI|nr:hypothetical protein PCASD_08881 [Puccinia coronata f. sp. avenae]
MMSAMSCHNRHTWHLPAIRGAELPWMGPNCHYDHTGPPTRHIIVSSTAEPADLSALLLSVPQPPSLCPSTFYLPCKLAGLKRSLSGPVASDLIGKLGPDHQLSPGYDRTVRSYPDFPYRWYRHTYPNKGMVIYKGTTLPL